MVGDKFCCQVIVDCLSPKTLATEAALALKPRGVNDQLCIQNGVKGIGGGSRRRNRELPAQHNKDHGLEKDSFHWKSGLNYAANTDRK